MSYESEMADGFAELTTEAGAGALSFGGVAITGILNAIPIHEGLKVDLKPGISRLLFLEVARSEIAKLSQTPKVGASFMLGSASLRITDVTDDDPGSVSIIYTVKKG